MRLLCHCAALGNVGGKWASLHYCLPLSSLSRRAAALSHSAAILCPFCVSSFYFFAYPSLSRLRFISLLMLPLFFGPLFTLDARRCRRNYSNYKAIMYILEYISNVDRNLKEPDNTMNNLTLTNEVVEKLRWYKSRNLSFAFFNIFYFFVKKIFVC